MSATKRNGASEIVAVAYRYTENPYDTGRVACLSCGDGYLARNDWDFIAHEVSAGQILGGGYGVACDECGDDLALAAAGCVDDAYLAARGLDYLRASI